MDAREIGLAVKDIVIGIGGAAAGIAGGPAAGEGVLKAGSAIDRIIENVAPAEKKPSRSEQFDRADFGTRPPQPAPPRVIPPRPKAPESVNQEEDESPTDDTQVATEYLQSVGWEKQKVTEIMGGRRPEEPPVVAPQPETPKDAMRTYEVYGVLNGKAVNLMRVLQHAGGRWHVLPGAGVRVTAKSDEGMGLAGSPGKWREYYPQKKPAEYGLDPNKGVLYWEPTKGKALAASTMLLSALFGRNWRPKVYNNGG